MPPLFLLALLLTATVGVVAVDRGRRRRSATTYRRLALAHGMHYSAGDPLRLTPRVAAALPVPGAAAVRVIDLLYGSDAAGHHYVFTAEYTVGVVNIKRRVRRAAAFDEPRGAAATTLTVRLAAAGLSLAEQYAALLGQAVTSV